MNYERSLLAEIAQLKFRDRERALQRAQSRASQPRRKDNRKGRRP